jgi:CRP-like cAMP-binding protein
MSPILDLVTIGERFRTVYALPPAAAASVASLLSVCDVSSLEDGEVLFTEREQGFTAYFLLSGKIGVSRRDAVGYVLDISTLSAPTLLGHMSLVDDSPRSATCTAIGPCVVAAMDRARFQALVAADGPRGSVLRRLLIAAMSEQLAGANGRILALIDPPPDFPADDETTEHGIEEAAHVLDGWKG